MKLDWYNIEDKIKNTKFKLVLLFKFFNLLDFIEDNIASILIRNIIKHHSDLFCEYPLYILCQYIPKNRFPETINSILTFYELLKEKINIILMIKKWNEAYNINKFWNLSLDDQIKSLKELKHKFLAIFDSTQGSMNIINRLALIVKQNDNYNGIFITMETLKERLRQGYLLLGSNFFILIKIPIITNNEFDLLKKEEKIKYASEYFLRSISVINQTQILFDSLYLINSKIDNFLNPYYINIEETTIDEDSIDENISDYFEK